MEIYIELTKELPTSEGLYVVRDSKGARLLGVCGTSSRKGLLLVAKAECRGERFLTSFIDISEYPFEPDTFFSKKPIKFRV